MRKSPTLADELLLTLLALGATDDDPEEEDDEDDQEHIRLKRRVNSLLERGSDSAEVKKLRMEAKKRRLENKDLKARLAELDGSGSKDLAKENRELRLRLEFERAGRHSGLEDVAAKDLFKIAKDDLATAMDDDGKIDKDKLRTIVESSLDQHPWAKANGSGDGDDDDTPHSSVNTTGAGVARGKPRPAQNKQALIDRFPALAGHIDR
jgi:hypothetical protein